MEGDMMQAGAVLLQIVHPHARPIEWFEQLKGDGTQQPALVIFARAFSGWP